MKSPHWTTHVLRLSRSDGDPKARGRSLLPRFWAFRSAVSPKTSLKYFPKDHINLKTLHVPTSLPLLLFLPRPGQATSFWQKSTQKGTYVLPFFHGVFRRFLSRGVQKHHTTFSRGNHGKNILQQKIEEGKKLFTKHPMSLFYSRSLSRFFMPCSSLSAPCFPLLKSFANFQL
jgi:hypothetical protein